MWIADFAANDFAGVFVAGSVPGVVVFEAESRALATRRSGTESVPSRKAFARQNDVWCRGLDGKERRITRHGTTEDSYRGRVFVSPDGKCALAFRVERGKPREVHMVDRRQAVACSLAWSRIPMASPVIESIDRVRWAEDGSEAFVLHNRRGHQVLTLFAIDAKSGAVRKVFEERSETFVDYSQKAWMHWLAGSRRCLWASECSGYNHLWLVDAKTGDATAVTQGEWVVRSVERVDEEKGEVWLAAMGIRRDQGPYHEHLVRVRLDGRDLTVLTAGGGTHDWESSPDRELFIARWSRVDQPVVTELRRSHDGALVAELGRDDASVLLAAGFRPPLRFSAKGRDGKTDSHGIVILPSNFDTERRYPVIESIYAGPHGHHVPKRWGTGLSRRQLAELGFVIVQIDGMGTNWRSKAFHDVCWRNLKGAGLPDRIAWLRAAAHEYPFLGTRSGGTRRGWAIRSDCGMQTARTSRTPRSCRASCC